MSLVIFAALLVCVGGIIKAYRDRADIQKASLTMTAAISLAISILVFPYYLKSSDLLIAVIEAFHAGVSGIALSVNGDIPYELELSETQLKIYRFFLYNLYIFGPIAGSMFLITFSANVKNALSFFGQKKYYVFSTLNDQSIAIAESIFDKKTGSKFIFCNVDEPEIDLANRVRGVHGIMLKIGEHELKLRKNKKYEFFEIYEEDKKRITATAKLCEELPKKKNYDDENIIVRIFADASQRELILNLDEQYSEELYLRHIDEDRSLALEALSLAKEDLCRKKGNHTAILCDSALGITLLKDLLCLSVSEEEYSITLISPDAEAFRDDLMKQVPEFEQYAVDFIERSYGSEASAFEKEKDYDCIFVLYEDDELAYKTAVQIRRVLSSFSAQLKCPKILCYVSDPSLHKIIKEEEIVLFGDLEKMCSYDVLVNPGLEKAAEKVHLSYLGMEKADEDVLENSGFYEYQNQESSFAEALALEYKKAYILSQKKDAQVSDRDFIDAWLAEHLEEAAAWEHERWNAYQRIHGWRKAEGEMIGSIIEKYKGERANDPKLRLHPAIVDYGDLENVQNEVNECFKRYGSDKRVDYLGADKDILKKMTWILDVK